MDLDTDEAQSQQQRDWIGPGLDLDGDGAEIAEEGAEDAAADDQAEDAAAEDAEDEENGDAPDVEDAAEALVVKADECSSESSSQGKARSSAAESDEVRPGNRMALPRKDNISVATLRQWLRDAGHGRNDDDDAEENENDGEDADEENLVDVNGDQGDIAEDDEEEDEATVEGRLFFQEQMNGVMQKLGGNSAGDRAVVHCLLRAIRKSMPSLTSRHPQSQFRHHISSPHPQSQEERRGERSGWNRARAEETSAQQQQQQQQRR